jgi:hypothetical protein
MTVFWVVASCSLVEVRCGKKLKLISDCGDSGSKKSNEAMMAPMVGSGRV